MPIVRLLRTSLTAVLWLGLMASTGQAQKAPEPRCDAPLQSGVDAALGGVDAAGGSTARSPLFVRRGSGSDLVCPPAGGSPTPFRLTPLARLEADMNTGYAVERNDGPMWAGRGGAAAVTGGARLRWGALSAAAAPTLVGAENRAFDFVELEREGYSRFAYARNNRGGSPRIDLPQRHGDEPVLRVVPGETYVRVDAMGLAAGAGTEAVWWGPTRRNALLLGTTAGFPHAFIGTGPPARLGPVRVETRLLWGRLAESDWFDDEPANDIRMLSGMLIVVSPAGAPGLTLGAARIYYQVVSEGGLALADFIPFLETPIKEGLADPENPGGNDVADQLAGVFARWSVPEAGFEAYLEWGRNDHAWDLDDLLQEPEHSGGYTAGLVKRVERRRRVRVAVEVTRLERTSTGVDRATPPFFAHHIVRQGFTHRGQLLAAPIGPDANAQFIGVDVMGSRGVWGGYVERVRRDARARYSRDELGNIEYDVELTAGLRHWFQCGAVSMGWSASYSHRLNRLGLEDDGNIRVAVRAHWAPGASP